MYFRAQNNFLGSFPRLLCIADVINLIFKCRLQWKALGTLNICKNFDGNWTRFHEDMEKTVKSALQKPPRQPKFGNCKSAYHPRNTFPLHSLNHDRLASEFVRCLSYMLVCWKSKEIKEFKGSRTDFWTNNVRASVRKCMSQGMGVPEKGSRFGSAI